MALKFACADSVPHGRVGLQWRRRDRPLWRSHKNSKMAASTRASVGAREVVRCDACLLIQFHSATEVCRRCGRPYIEPEPDEPLLVPLPVTPTLAVALRSARLRLGLSQRQLAARISVPRTYVSKLENDKASPTLSSLERVATALDVTIAELLSDQETVRRGRIEVLMSDSFIATVAPLVSRLSEVQRRTVLAELSAMVSRAGRATVPRSASRTQLSGSRTAMVVW